MPGDRFLIYELKGRTIHAEVPSHLGGFTVDGSVDDVFRDVMRERIQLSVNARLFFFREPDVIFRREDHSSIVFVYGFERDDPSDDDQVFHVMHSQASSGVYIDRALEETAIRRRSVIIFELMD